MHEVDIFRLYNIVAIIPKNMNLIHDDTKYSLKQGLIEEIKNKERLITKELEKIKIKTPHNKIPDEFEGVFCSVKSVLYNSSTSNTIIAEINKQINSLKTKVESFYNSKIKPDGVERIKQDLAKEAQELEHCRVALMLLITDLEKSKEVYEKKFLGYVLEFLEETKLVLENYDKFGIDLLEKGFFLTLPYLQHLNNNDCKAFCEKFIEILKKSGSGLDWVLRINGAVEIGKKFLP